MKKHYLVVLSVIFTVLVGVAIFKQAPSAKNEDGYYQTPFGNLMPYGAHKNFHAGEPYEFEETMTKRDFSMSPFPHFTEQKLIVKTLYGFSEKEQRVVAISPTEIIESREPSADVPYNYLLIYPLLIVAIVIYKVLIRNNRDYVWDPSLLLFHTAIFLFYVWCVEYDSQRGHVSTFKDLMTGITVSLLIIFLTVQVIGMFREPVSVPEPEENNLVPAS